MPPFDLERSETIISSHTSPLRAVLVAVAVGAAFGAGALTGKTGTAKPAMEAAPLAAADRRTEELERRRAELKLGFASELPRADPIKKPLVLAQTKARGSVHESAPTPIEAPPEREPEKEAAAEAPKAPGPSDPSVDDEEPEAEKKRSDPARVKQALAKVLGSPAVDSRAEQKPEPVRRTYTLQVASTPVRENAEQLRKKLEDEGHAARVVEADLEGGKKVYRVRVGAFDAREKADALKATIAMPTFVVSE